MMLSPERGTILRWKYDYKLEVYKGVATTTNLVFKSWLQTTGTDAAIILRYFKGS